MKLNENIFYYLPRKSVFPGSFGATTFVLKGSKNPENQYLVDPGTAAGGMGKKQLNLMNIDGVDIYKTKGILFTHEHPDHVAGGYFYQKLIGNVPALFNENGLKLLEEPDLLKASLLGDLGSLKKEVTRMPSFLVSIGFDYLYGKIRPLKNLVGIKEGMQFPLNEDKSSFIEVFTAPGHSLNHMAYLVHCENGQKVLLSGDIISFKENLEGKIISLASLNNPLSSYVDELQTMQKFIKLDIDIMFSAHYGMIKGADNIKEQFFGAIERIQGYERTIIEELEKKPMGIKELTEKTIKMKHYLSGYATKPSTVYSILMHLSRSNRVYVDKKNNLFKLMA